jgi:hypothetical protein
MFHPIRAYRKSQEVQYNWIRNHPVQYVVLNATLLVMFFGYIKYKDRREARKLAEEHPTPEIV